MRLNIIAERLERLAQAEPTSAETLRVVPLTGASATEPAYRLLDDTVEDEVAITEVDEEGSVPELRVRNDLESHLLLLAGQELIGAKQNRVLNTDVLVAPKSEQRVPVSCVEAGRWHRVSKAFRPGKFAPSSMRSGKSADVAEGLASGAGHAADQGRVWEDVDEVLCCMGAPSPTAAMHEVYEKIDAELAGLRERLTLPGDAVGIAVFDGQRLLGLDLFDRASTLAAIWETLHDSYALDCLMARRISVETDPASIEQVDGLVHELSGSEWNPYDAPGLGTDYRLEHEHLTGSALVWEDQSIVHLQVFPIGTSSRTRDGRQRRA